MKFQNARCECGANHYRVTAKPIVRFYCHCRVCQEYSGKEYSDVVVALTRDVELSDVSHSLFRRMKLPPNIRRGHCTVCGKPSIEFGLGDALTFIPARNYANKEELPPASMHIFYHRRIRDAEDSIPKYEGFWRSQLVTIRMLLPSLLNSYK
jgi:hypothetical protein